MGASPKHKLSPAAVELLEWLNTPSDQVRYADPEAEVRKDLLANNSHFTLSDNTLARMHDFLYGCLEAHSRYLVHGGSAKGELTAVLPIIEEGLLPMPYKHVFDQGGPHFIPAPERLEEEAQWMYRVAVLFNDLWEKGPDRLKKCAWPKCRRFLWDSTTNRKKKYCESRHDKARSRLRARRSR